MSFEDFKRILDQFPRLKWIGLTGIGESFLNKDFLRMLKLVKSRGIYVELYDQFFFINKEIARELIEMGVDKLFISLDAAKKETYEKIRVGSNFDLVTGNLKNFFELKREMNAHFPEIAFHFIVNKLNIGEIPQYLDLDRSITKGKNEDVQITRMLHKFKEVENLFCEIPAELIKKANEKAREMEINLSWSADVPRLKPPVKKCTEWLMPFIFVSGDVIPCCAGNEAGQRTFQKETALGNVFETPFKGIWQGKKYKNLRKTLYQNKVPLACKNCCLYETEVKGRDEQQTKPI
jgi:pyrroloquinoline quinone biosynthesis protein E